MQRFATRVIAWQHRAGRHDLPWQRDRDPYRIWLSEIMLQQTQVATVIPYYERFLGRFPDVASLAAAGEDEVMRHWAGLGYYARGRNLHRAARDIVARHGGEFPRELADVHALPGIGRSTAAAICALAFGQRHAILDGNVKRVLARQFGIAGDPATRAVEEALWARAEAELPATGIEAYVQGLMDLGATLCTRGRPRCGACPVASTCVALRDGRVEELPGKRVRVAAPRRATQMLVIVSRGKVLLEKRPSPGIWGGLWSLPEAGVEEDPAAVVRARLALDATRVTPLAAITHAFTHFTLDISPVRVDVARQAGHQVRADSAWLAWTAAAAAGVPAPVKRLLEDCAAS